MRRSELTLFSDLMLTLTNVGLVFTWHFMRPRQRIGCKVFSYQRQRSRETKKILSSWNIEVDKIQMFMYFTANQSDAKELWFKVRCFHVESLFYFNHGTSYSVPEIGCKLLSTSKSTTATFACYK